MVKPTVDLYPVPASVKKAIDKAPLIIGIGPSAWPRVVTGFYFPNFKIISYNDCEDNDFIKESGVDVFSIREEDPSIEVSPETPAQILSTKSVESYLKNINEPFVFLIYKSSPKLEKLRSEKGWKFIANSHNLRETYENKKIFKDTIRELGIKAIPGENIPLAELTKENFEAYQDKLGTKDLVLQIAEMTYGGGSGTLFISDSKDLSIFEKRLNEISEVLEGKKKQMQSVNIAPFIKGTTASIACCATRYGVLTGPIQSQIVDIAEVGTKMSDRSGNYAGHDWVFKNYSEESQKQASQIAERFGDHIYKKGYRGIFGLDLIVEEDGTVWPVECNPRDTDAFPLISMQQMESGVPPMDVFHNLEFMDIDYDFDFEEINKAYKTKYAAGQILIHNRLEGEAVSRDRMSAGIYKLNGDEMEYVRKGFHFSDLKDENEFLFVENVQKQKQKFFGSKGRIFRLIRRGGILESEHKLLPDVAKVIEKIYEKIKLTPVPVGVKELEGVEALYSDKLLTAKKEMESLNPGFVNIYFPSEGGIRRPNKIAWRKEIDSKKSTIEQIKSWRARKQIKSDLAKLDKIGLEIKTYEDLPREVFEKWHNLYEEIISSKAGGKVVIGKDWYDGKKAEGKKIGACIAYQNGEIIGGDLFFKVKDILTVGYGVAQRLDNLQAGLGLLLDYFAIDFARQNGYKTISFGQDTNLYGGDLSVGLFQYKSKLGFKPQLANKAYFVTTYFLNFESFSDPIVFLTGSDSNLALTVIYDREDFNKDDILVPEGIIEVNFIKRNKVESDHKKFFETVK